MSRQAPDEAVLTAIVARLRAVAAVTTTATSGTYTEVPQGTPPPYNVVSQISGARQDTCGKLGKTSLVDVMSISEGASQQPGARMRAAVIAALDLQNQTVTGHTMFGLAYEGDVYFAEIVNATKTHHHIASFRVWTEQA